MADIIIVIVVVLLIGAALKSSVKHFKGEGSCCGGGSSLAETREEKILGGPVIGKKTIKISGMHCENCVNSVTRAINKIEGVRAQVSLSSSSAVVSYDREVSEKELKQAIEEAGFGVTNIS
ncbi:heavy-metal-associated domain-containing protein [Mediterraneibacter sp. ICN-202921]|jgi:copper chaperone|uniref:heavy-metal-associated domain-containing protein n=1 Tax=Mediterraneibacter sp. ICN-202921 TaxID=3134657 RepID=UPI000E4C0CA6|nr:heavy-metal-associated domain-containing protein [Ruminococcus sp. AF18-22]